MLTKYDLVRIVAGLNQCSRVICFAVSGANLEAADPDASPTPDPVAKKVDELREAAKSTADMVQAEARGMELWDAELNRVYRLLLIKLPGPDRSKLINSQRVWLTFRDANREIYAIFAILCAKISDYLTEGDLHRRAQRSRGPDGRP